jgi:hypothetical protein
LDFTKGQVWDVQAALYVERRPGLAFNAQYGPHTDQRQAVQQATFLHAGLVGLVRTLDVHIPKLVGKRVDKPVPWRPPAA